MDILSHALSGTLVATSLAAFNRKGLRHSAGIIACGTAGAVLPDIDTITLWSKFDTTIGTRLDLPYTGQSIYFGNHAFSHHNITHSLIAALVVAALAGMAFYFSGALKSHPAKGTTALKDATLALMALFAGYLMHLVGDLPTPGHTWQGIKLFWPSPTPVGGTGQIWWWNNYDIFLLLAMGCLVNLLLIPFYRLRNQRGLRFLMLAVTIISVSTSAYQITHRPVRFSEARGATAHKANEQRSLDAQRAILGATLFDFMRSLDRRLPIYF